MTEAHKQRRRQRRFGLGALAEIDAFLRGEDFRVHAETKRRTKARDEARAYAKKLFLSSPWIEVLRNEYEANGLHKWTNARVGFVCRIFHCTLYEACALVGEFDHKKVREHKAKNQWPMYLTLQWSKLVDFKLQATRPPPDAQDIASVKLLRRAA